MFFASLSILALVGIVPLAFTQPSIDDQILQLQRSKSKLLQYPTQLSQGIVPRAIHSHNDYWRDVPLLTAISLGVVSVEADVWLVNGELLVGHELAALTKDRTFESLYVAPLQKMIQQQNPKNAFTVNQTRPNGIFDTSSGTPLLLLVDIKTDGPETFPFVVKALEPLRSARFLTTFTNGTMQQSAVTVIGTGNTPLDDVQRQSPRDVFFDAPLTNLTNGTIKWDRNVAPLASTDYATAVGWSGINAITDAQLASINKLVSDAHSLGLAARFWDTPGWPIFARNNIWKQLLESGADLLNADDIQAASEF